MKPVSNTFKLILGLWLGIIIVAGMLTPIPFIPGLGEAARNIFFHVPQSFTMLFIVLISFWQSIQYLRTKKIEYDIKASASASVGMLFGILTIITGAVWADFTWGTYWNWDPRQTTFLGLLLIYSAYFVLRTSVDDPQKKAVLSAAYNLFAFASLPFLMFIIPRLLPGLHPGAPEEGGSNNPMVSGVDSTIRIIMYSSVIGFCMLSYWIYNLKVRLAILEEKINS